MKLTNHWLHSIRDTWDEAYQIAKTLAIYQRRIFIVHQVPEGKWHVEDYDMQLGAETQDQLSLRFILPNGEVAQLANNP